jgi:hypothetical protein
MRYLTVEEALEINAEVMGGRHVLRDRGLLVLMPTLTWPAKQQHCFIHWS